MDPELFWRASTDGPAGCCQVSASSQNLAAGAREQASLLEETSSSLEELTSMSKRNAELTEKCKGWIGEARVLVGKVYELLNETAVHPGNQAFQWSDRQNRQND